jgi:hypothetical protein
VTDMSHPQHDLVTGYSEALDYYEMLRQPVSPLEDESHEELVTAFFAEMPPVGPQPEQVSADEEVEVLRQYAAFLDDRGDLVRHPLLTPAVAAERFLERLKNDE